VRTSRTWIAAAAFSVVACVAVLPVGVAYADCTTAGDYGAGAGCSPPGSSGGSGNTESWPPTSVDWPPQLGSDSDKDSGDKGGGGAKPTPIVMPNGQKPPPASPPSGSDSTGTSTPPTPIVPVGLGAHSNESEHKRNTEPDRDCARLAPSPCAELGARRYLGHG
jgi:hypothetical protein